MFTLETGDTDRDANMWTFTRAALDLLEAQRAHGASLWNESPRVGFMNGQIRFLQKGAISEIATGMQQIPALWVSGQRCGKREHRDGPLPSRHGAPAVQVAHRGQWRDRGYVPGATSCCHTEALDALCLLVRQRNARAKR